ncbi:isoprenoid synthase domain-containing protein [Biscogniauxia mediterranea]|nr:isoprenoid synthase domain-containing protein [Biscogniauxia mediterranea]
MKDSFLRFVQRLRYQLTCPSLSSRGLPSTKRQSSSSSSSSSSPVSEKTDFPPGLHGEALELAKALHGKTLHVSDLREVFAAWPSAVNKHAKELEVLVDSLLDRVITNERKRKALKQADFARLLSLWYPHAEWAELEVATAYSVWIFVWDDEIDAGDTDAAHDENLARAYYKQSLDYIHHMLGLDEEEDASKDKAPNQNMTLFGDVGRGVVGATDKLQRQRFFRELENFMDQVGVEHNHRMAGTIPTLEEYLKIRSGSVGCAPQIALTDHMLRIRLPEEIMDSEAMQALWKETILLCLILNDVYSVQKEIAQGSLLNMVPAMFKNLAPEKQTLEVVSKEVDVALKGSMERFEIAAKTLSETAPDDATLNKNIQDFVEWCRYFTTGVLYWSLESRRYGMADCINPDGSLDIVL